MMRFLSVEAEYAFEMRKPMLPIQVQAGYRPDGWLGFICGTKYRYSLVRHDKYEDEMAALMGKIADLTSQHAPTSAASGEWNLPVCH